MMNSISRNKRRSPHACRSAVGTFICASNGIGPAQYAASSHLTIWTEPPGWAVWLLRHKTRKTMHNQQRKESK